MKKYTKISAKNKNEARIELHDKLNLTGSEISLNILPSDASVPFVHAHKENEEVYFVIKGTGTFVIDEEKIELNEGDFIKISPAGKRQIFAGENGITYLCIQTKTDSLTQYTADDAIIC